jgi:hypothetical protein
VSLVVARQATSDAPLAKEVFMRRWVAVAIAGACAAAPLALGVTSASAATTYTCTKTVHGQTATVKVHRDRAEDALEAHGFTCSRG